MHRERNAAATNGKLSIETRIGSSDDGLFRGFVISLSFWCAITFQIRIDEGFDIWKFFDIRRE